MTTSKSSGAFERRRGARDLCIRQKGPLGACRGRAMRKGRFSEVPFPERTIGRHRRRGVWRCSANSKSANTESRPAAARPAATRGEGAASLGALAATASRVDKPNPQKSPKIPRHTSCARMAAKSGVAAHDSGLDLARGRGPCAAHLHAHRPAPLDGGHLQPLREARLERLSASRTPSRLPLRRGLRRTARDAPVDGRVAAGPRGGVFATTFSRLTAPRRPGAASRVVFRQQVHVARLGRVDEDVPTARERRAWRGEGASWQRSAASQRASPQRPSQAHLRRP